MPSLPAASVELARFPRAHAYVSRLPHGLDSYPDHFVKSALFRSLIDAQLARDCTDLPAPLAELVLRPPPLSSWVRQVHAHAIVALARDVLFDQDEHFARFCYDEQRRLFGGRLYALLMRCTTPERLLGAAEHRWAAVNRGCGIDVTLAERSATLVIRHPQGMYNATVLVALCQGIRATLELSRAGKATVELKASAPLRTECVARW